MQPAQDEIEDEYCYCCGRGDGTLVPCPRCGEALCQDCLDDGAHLCEVE